ncbi:MAG: hypothetical protein WBQ94_03660 [Terracidiphilus sp.]
MTMPLQFDLQPVPKGNNLRAAGWTAGYMLVVFRSGEKYLYGPEIEEEELKKILRVPYPDSQFTRAVKAKFKVHKLGAK